MIDYTIVEGEFGFVENVSSEKKSDFLATLDSDGIASINQDGDVYRFKMYDIVDFAALESFFWKNYKTVIDWLEVDLKGVSTLDFFNSESFDDVVEDFEDEIDE